MLVLVVVLLLVLVTNYECTIRGCGDIAWRLIGWGSVNGIKRIFVINYLGDCG